MKLAEFIGVLQEIQKEAGEEDPVVVLSDWSENYVLPSEWAAETIMFDNCTYRSKEDSDKKQGKVVVIGDF